MNKFLNKYANCIVAMLSIFLGLYLLSNQEAYTNPIIPTWHISYAAITFIATGGFIIIGSVYPSSYQFIKNIIKYIIFPIAILGVVELANFILSMFNLENEKYIPVLIFSLTVICNFIFDFIVKDKA